MENTEAVQAEPAADEAAYAELQKQFGDQPSEPSEPEAKAEPEQPEQQDEPKDRLPYEELEKRHRNLNGALAQERAERRAMAQRLDNMQKVFEQLAQQRQAPPQEEQQWVDPLEQKIGSIEQKFTTWEKQQQEAQQRLQAETQKREVYTYANQAEAEFAKATPDYMEAAAHLQQARMSELSLMFPDDDYNAQEAAFQAGFQSVDQYRRAILANEADQIVQQAYRTRRNPAETVYQLAKARGWQSKPAVPQKPQIDAVKEARAKAPDSLSGATSSGGGDFPSIEELADMYKSDPAKADAVFEKMAKAGLLG